MITELERRLAEFDFIDFEAVNAKRQIGVEEGKCRYVARIVAPVPRFAPSVRGSFLLGFGGTSEIGI